MICRSDGRLDRVGVTTSPTTGKSTQDFMVDAYEKFGAKGGTKTGFAALIERSTGNCWSYFTGKCDPPIWTMRLVESEIGLRMDDYVPEINMGAEAMRCIESWKTAWQRDVLAASGLHVNCALNKAIRKGTFDEKNLTAGAAVSAYALYRWWTEEGQFQNWGSCNRKREKNRRICEDQDNISLTGKTVTEYVIDAFEGTKMTRSQFARAVNASEASVCGWLKGLNEPTVKVLRKIETVSGLPIEEYLPEVDRGVELLRTAPEWPDGFVRWKMARFGVTFGDKRMQEARCGICNENGKLSPSMLVRFCRYYDYWQKHGDAVFRLNGGKMPDGISDEELTAFNVYQSIMGRASVNDFHFCKLRKGVWQFETERWYRGEIDLNEKELRIYSKLDGELSFRRKLNARA